MYCINDLCASGAATGFQTFYRLFCGKEHRIWLIYLIPSLFHLIADAYSSSFNVSNENTMGNQHHHHHQLQINPPEISKKIPLNSYGFMATSSGPGTIWRSPQREDIVWYCGGVAAAKWGLNCRQRWWPWIRNCCLWAYFHQCFGDFMYFSISKMALNFIVVRSQQFCCSKKMHAFFPSLLLLILGSW